VGELHQLAAATRAEFESIDHSSLPGNPEHNPKLVVEASGAAMVGDTPTLILITPWSIYGMMFLGEGPAIQELVVGKRCFPGSESRRDNLGRYSSVNLVPDVTGFADREEARHAATALAEPFREAVARALREQSVANPERRDLFRRLAGGASLPPRPKRT
jgi:hypothetical protein